MSKTELMIHLFNAMKAGYHCWAEFVHHRYDFYCDAGRH